MIKLLIASCIFFSGCSHKFSNLNINVDDFEYHFLDGYGVNKDLQPTPEKKND